MAGEPEMNGNGNGTFDALAQYARLSERVENQGKDIVDLRSNMNTGFQTINANLSALSNELRSNGKTQWPVIWTAAGVCFTVLTVVGGFFYNTLSKDVTRLDSALLKTNESVQLALSGIPDKFVSQKEMETRTARSAEERARTDAAIKEIRDGLVPRAEHQRVWQNTDDRFRDQQRQIDEMKQAQGSTYGVRDLLLDMRERLDRLERTKGG